MTDGEAEQFSFKELEMSVQSVRRGIANIVRLEAIIWAEKGVVVPRDKRWEQARTLEFWFNDLVRHIEGCYMPAKKIAASEKKQAEFKGFVNYVLSAEDKEMFSKWDVDDHDLFLLAAGGCQQGYKMGVSFNPKNDTFTATFMCTDSDSPNAGYILSAFAPDWYNAVKSLLFKHDVVLYGIWNVEKAKDLNNWG